MRWWTRLGRLEWSLASVGAGLCLFVMMLVTVVSVFGRYVLETDLIPGAYNLIERILFPLIVFWAVPLAFREGTFPRLELTDQALRGRAGCAVRVFVRLVELAITAVILWYVAGFALDGYRTARTMQIGTGFWPVWPLLAMVPLAFALMLIDMARFLVDEVRALLAPPGGAGAR